MWHLIVNQKKMKRIPGPAGLLPDSDYDSDLSSSKASKGSVPFDESASVEGDVIDVERSRVPQALLKPFESRPWKHMCVSLGRNSVFPKASESDRQYLARFRKSLSGGDNYSIITDIIEGAHAVDDLQVGCLVAYVKSVYTSPCATTCELIDESCLAFGGGVSIRGWFQEE